MVQNASFSTDVLSNAQIKVRDFEAHHQKLTQDLLKRNQKTVIQSVDIESTGDKYEQESQVSDFW